MDTLPERHPQTLIDIILDTHNNPRPPHPLLTIPTPRSPRSHPPNFPTKPLYPFYSTASPMHLEKCIIPPYKTPNLSSYLTSSLLTDSTTRNCQCVFLIIFFHTLSPTLPPHHTYLNALSYTLLPCPLPSSPPPAPLCGELRLEPQHCIN